MRRNNRGSKNLVCALQNNHSDESFLLAVDNSPIDFMKRSRENVHCKPLLSTLPLVETNMGNLRVRVNAPRHDQGAEFFPPEKERILNYDAGGSIRRMRKLPFHANVSSAINMW